MAIRKLEENQIDILKTAICRDFYLSCKTKTDLKIGTEIERLPVYTNSFEAVNYFGANGLYRLLRQIAYNDEWSYITDLTFINGLKKGETTITLEPGGQTEYSLAPRKTIFELKNDVEKLDAKLQPILNYLGIMLLEYPVTPVTNGQDIEIVPKRRYQTMARYMRGEKCHTMMRETAGIQVAIDYTDEIDAMRKFKLSMMLSPFVTAMFANSPIRCGKNTGFKSYRASAWLKTDESRCGFVSKKLFDHNEQFSFADYVNAVFDVPMLFAQRENEIIEIGGKMSFDEYAKYGFENLSATREDYNLHSTLFFPEVRLKNIIEIRNQDTQQGAMKYAIPALYKGIMYSQTALNDTFELLKRLTYADFCNLRQDVPVSAIKAKIGNKTVLDYIKVILNISYQGLLSQKTGEEKLLEPIMQLVYDNLCPADVVLKDWNSSFKCSIDKLAEHMKVK